MKKFPLAKAFLICPFVAIAISSQIFAAPPELLGTIETGVETDSLKFSPDGKLLAGASGEGAIYLWDAKTGKSTAVTGNVGGDTSPFAFSPDGKTLVYGSYDANT